MILVLRIIFGALFLFFLPGFCLLGAIFPHRDDLDNLERLGIGMGISISLIAALATVLNFTSWGIQPGSLIVSIGLLLVLFSLVAFCRLRKIPPQERFLDSYYIGRATTGKTPKQNVLISVFLALLLLVAFGAAGYLGTTPSVGDSLTQFYLLDPDGQVYSYPNGIRLGDPITLTLGITNWEHRDVDYRVEKVVEADSEQIANIQLSHGKTWEQSYSFVVNEPVESRKVVFQLYRENDPDPYRSLHLWITVK